MKELTQTVFNGQPIEVDWCGVDFDGLLSFGKALSPRTTYASERWRGFELIGTPVLSDYRPMSELCRVLTCKICGNTLTEQDLQEMFEFEHDNGFATDVICDSCINSPDDNYKEDYEDNTRAVYHCNACGALIEQDCICNED